LRHITRLAWRDDKAQRPPKSIRKQVDFGGQSSSRTPQSLCAGPPFPVAAC
jgi:hypothetical protein